MPRASLTALLVVSSTACLPTYEFGARPLPPSPRNESDRCYQRERLEVSSGNARWSYTETESVGLSTTRYRTRQFSSGGLTFFRGGERIAPTKALDLLGDGELRAEYQRKLDATSTAHATYPVWRNGSLLMATGGLALSGVALAQVLAMSHEERVQASIPSTLWVGAGLALLSIVPAALASVTYDKAIQHDRATHLFDEPPLLPRLDEALRRFNQRAAARCGASPEPDPPGPPDDRAR